MKVILTRDVKGLGRTHEEINASDGYALNYLIPQKFAVPATASAKQTAELRRKHMKDRVELDHALIKQTIESLASQTPVIRRKVNEKGHLYDAVGASDIASVVNLPEEAIKLEKPIKEVGTFDIPVAIGETFGSFKITVETE